MVRRASTHGMPVLAVFALLATACSNQEPARVTDSAPSAAAGERPATTPGWITTRIQAQYFADPDIKPWNIDVTTTSGGAVTLRGDVDSPEARAEAVRIARETEGVTAVEDLLRVKRDQVATSGREPVENSERASDDRRERPDLWITTKVQAKYFTDDEVRGRNIDVDTQGGVVTLRGTVDTYAARRQAVALARNTEGVREVRDELRVDAAADATASPTIGDRVDDAWIEAKIQSKYFLDPQVKGRSIDVEVAGGIVTLAGTVGSEAEKQIAEQIARETEGVTDVKNQLEMRADASAPR